MSRSTRLGVKAAVWIAALAPLAWLGWRAWTGNLTANPINFLTDQLGLWALRLLLASLALTPLRIVFGWGWPALLRRLLGLFAFTFAVLHFSVWILVDHFFNWAQMAEDIVKRPYITVGMLALLTLIPLAATSTAGMIKRLGAKNWRRLHRLVYVAGVLGVVHYLWLAKVGVKTPWIYAFVLALVLGIRAVEATKRRLKVRSTGRAPVSRPASGTPC